MLKIFMTQLQGYFKKIHEQEEMNLEDGARVLAQASIGDGTIYIHGFSEMDAILTEAIYGAEPFQSAKPLYIDGKMAELSQVDRVLLISRFSTDEEAIKVAKNLQENGYQTVAISALIEKAESESLVDFVDVHIDSKLTKAILPDEDGTRFGFPSIMTSLFAYYGLVFTIKEILSDYE